MPPRKKTKLKAKLEAAAENNSNASATEVDTSRRNLRGRTGGLKDMPKMPLDILIEIFSLLHPRDLLSLARSSKDFRALLMSRNSASFWKAARQQVAGLPECPPYLSEPAYANLVFSTHCHRCLKSSTKSAIWEFSARYCQDCKEDMLMYCHPHSQCQVNLELGEQLGFVIFPTHVMAATKGSTYEGAFYHRPDVQVFKAKYASLSTLEEKRDYAKVIAEQAESRYKFADSMRQWKLDQVESRSAELDVIKRARFESILEHLRDEDWGDELDLMSPRELAGLEHYKACRKSQKLTEHGWQSIRHDVIQFMESMRTARLEHEHQEAINRRVAIMFDFMTQWEQSGPPRSAETDWHPHFAD
ncbi:hypothetical protein C8Q80DRAFT_881284 [Daedaleopsis nitida]|nr:hypothetical protein C8Q80DRAFT_881284 [Daedaleopsis nitida]